jgi:exosortase
VLLSAALFRYTQRNLTTVIEQPPHISPKSSFGQMAALACALLALWFVLCRHLSNEWSVNEQYNYGWFVPFFALYLFWLRWEDRPNAQPPSRNGWIAIGLACTALLILLPIRLFEIANPDWRPLAWVHASAVAVITVVVIWRVGGQPWLRHFAFSVGFFFVAVPWVTPIEQPIVQGLMRFVAAVATEALNLFGIAAQLEGSLIRVDTGLVGVNEACSGVRSLQTSLMIGLLFGELKRLSFAHRVALVFLALGVALIANFSRAFFLVWIAATRGTSAVSKWHDLAGYMIVGVVFAACLALAARLGRKGENRNSKVEESKKERSGFLLPMSYFLLCFCWLLLVEVAIEGWYRWHERDLISRAQWAVRWPENAPGFREIKIDEAVRRTLGFDRGREAAWPVSVPVKDDPSKESAASCFLFFARWDPGTSSILRARAHRPDVCLPNVGWRQMADTGLKSYSVTENFALPARHMVFVHESAPAETSLFADTFFCLREDRVRRDETSIIQRMAGGAVEWAVADRYRAVREGLRNLGQQVMEVILVAPHRIDPEKAEAKFNALIREVVVVDANPKT